MQFLYCEYHLAFCSLTAAQYFRLSSLSFEMSDGTSETDDLILSLLAKDDPQASTLMFKAYYRPVYDTMRRIIRDDDESKDVVLELFCAIWEKRHSLRLTKPIKRYLLVAARHRAFNHLESRHRTEKFLREFADRSMTPVAPSAERDLEAQELNDIVSIAICMIPERSRLPYLLNRRLGMTYREIAKFLNQSEKTVEKNISHALTLLRKYIEPYLRH